MGYAVGTARRRGRRTPVRALIARTSWTTLQSSIVICAHFDTEGPAMASITIRNLGEDIERRLRIRAAKHGRSMEEEAHDILRRAIVDAESPLDLAAAIRARVTPAARVDLERPARGPMREAPRLGRRPR
ncbi:MAG: hypothetical protein R3E48_20535 [Burkholderiaceae bacterium]